jgi:hypothetical protein
MFLGSRTRPVCRAKSIVYISLYITRVKCIITLLSLHVSSLLGHHVTNVYNYNIKDIPIQRIRCYIIGVLYYKITNIFNTHAGCTPIILRSISAMTNWRPAT